MSEHEQLSHNKAGKHETVVYVISTLKEENNGSASLMRHQIYSLASHLSNISFSPQSCIKSILLSCKVSVSMENSLLKSSRPGLVVLIVRCFVLVALQRIFAVNADSDTVCVCGKHTNCTTVAQ